MVCNQSSQPLPNWGDPPSTKSDSMFLQKSVPDIISIYIYIAAGFLLLFWHPILS